MILWGIIIIFGIGSLILLLMAFGSLTPGGVNAGAILILPAGVCAVIAILAGVAKFAFWKLTQM